MVYNSEVNLLSRVRHDMKGQPLCAYTIKKNHLVNFDVMVSIHIKYQMGLVFPQLWY